MEKKTRVQLTIDVYKLKNENKRLLDRITKMQQRVMEKEVMLYCLQTRLQEQGYVRNVAK